MRYAGVAGAVLAGVGAAAVLLPDARTQFRRTSEGARRRAFWGVVVTAAGDPLPGVTLEVEDSARGATDAAGEFCVFLDTTRSVLATARREGFRTRAVIVPSGSDDVEALVRMELAPEPAAPPSRTFHLVDASSRGLVGAQVAILDSAGRELASARSRADGSVRWPGAAAGESFGLRVRPAEGGMAWIPGLRLRPGAYVPVALPSSAQEFVAVQVEGTLADGARILLFDAGARRLARGNLRAGRFEGLVPAAGVLWMRADDGAVTMLRKIERPRGGRVVRAVGRRVEVAATDELAAALPVLVPDFGEPAISVGAPVPEDPAESAFHAIPLVRSHGRFVSPELDVGDVPVRIRPRREDADVRILADLEAHGPAPARVARGAAEVVVQVEGAATGAPAALVATLARRTGAFRVARRVAAGETVSWSGLCCGAFALSLAREEPVATSGGCAAQAEELRRVLVAPGSRVVVTIRPDPADTARVTLTATRRGETLDRR